jgi:outer membrane protein assembly factor BamD
MSYYQQIADVTRDQAITQQALDSFGELVRRYPESRYAADARLKMDLLKDHLAGKEMEVGRYYERSGKWLAATYRFRSVVDQYQTTSHAPEALERLVECYLALGVPDEAYKAAAVLGKNYPETYWYRQSLRLLIKDQQHIYGRANTVRASATPAQPALVKEAPQAPSANAYPEEPPKK